MSSPYINTQLSTSVILHPFQMDNKVYINIKKNIENKLVGKCFSDYGYVVKIIEILKYGDAPIEAENVESSALIPVDFSCRICHPLRNSQYIFEIQRVNKLLITAINGPILVIITNDRVNNEIFFKDNNNNLRYKKDGVSNVLQPHDFIKVTLLTIQSYDGDEKIKAIGFMNDMASEGDQKNYYSDLYKEVGEIINYETYIAKPGEKGEEIEITD